MATKQGAKPSATDADQEFDPKFEWIENPTNFVLRVNLPGFKKEDFRVQVDSAGRLTVRGQRPADDDGKIARFHKVFQLPSISNLDAISGRFDASVLTITVPKRPAIIQEIEKPKEPEKDTKPPVPKEDDAKPKDDEAAKKTTDAMPPKEEAAKPKDDEAAKKTTDTMPPKEEDAKPKKELDEASKVQHKEEEEEAAAKKRKQEQEQSQRRPSLLTESLAEWMRRRAEDDRAKAAAAAEEEEGEEDGVWWLERARGGELEELKDMKWANDLVEMARKNKEVIAAAAAVAAFSLGFFLSRKLLSRK